MGRENSLLQKISAKRRLFGNPYAFLNDSGAFDAIPLRPNTLIQKNSAGTTIKNRSSSRRKQIEQTAIALQRDLWRDSRINSSGKFKDPFDILDPATAAKHLGISFVVTDDGLGAISFGKRHIEVAGLINRDKKKIYVSKRLPLQTLRFTGAHELGHWILHPNTVMHRDRALDGTHENPDRNPIEREADYFAACFLMPRKLVSEQFSGRFGATLPLVFNDDTEFKLLRGVGTPQSTSKSPLWREKLLATAEYYDGTRFESIAAQFRVSPTSMAIRIKELGLVCY